jgi:hypothetical protein
MFLNNTYCEGAGWPNRSDGTGGTSPWPFCKGFTPHKCSNTTSIFSSNVKQCKTDDDSHQPDEVPLLDDSPAMPGLQLNFQAAMARLPIMPDV